MATSRHLGLLRGINVGGHNKIKMADLRAAFEACGARNVSTYIQSGNVLFEATARQAPTICRKVEKVIASDHEIVSPVVHRTAAEFLAVATAGHPLLERGDEPKLLGVGFLSKAPTKAAVTALDPNRSPPDTFVVSGAHIFLRFPNGSARSKLTVAYLDKALNATTTVRNWNTIEKIAAMLT